MPQIVSWVTILCALLALHSFSHTATASLAQDWFTEETTRTCDRACVSIGVYVLCFYTCVSVSHPLTSHLSPLTHRYLQRRRSTHNLPSGFLPTSGRHRPCVSVCIACRWLHIMPKRQIWRHRRRSKCSLSPSFSLCVYVCVYICMSPPLLCVYVCLSLSLMPLLPSYLPPLLY